MKQARAVWYTVRVINGTYKYMRHDTRRKAERFAAKYRDVVYRIRVRFFLEGK